MRTKPHVRRGQTKLFVTLIILLAVGAQAHAQGIAYFSYGTGAQVGGIRRYGDFGIDLNGDGSVDFRFVSESGDYFHAEPQGQNMVLGYPLNALRYAFMAKRLQAGDVLASTSSPGLEWVGYQGNSSTYTTGPILIMSFGSESVGGEFPSRFGTVPGESFPRVGYVQEGYVGVQFFGADGLHYGWIRVRGGYQSYGTILDYAYNTVPGQGLAAGVVPEPSTWALLAVGAAAFCFGRRK